MTSRWMVCVFTLLLSCRSESGGMSGDGGTGGAAGDRGTGGSNGTGVIGREGGVVTGEQGVTVTIPAGALASETTIAAIVVEASGLPPRPSGMTAAGPFVALTPHGTQFAVPVEVALPYASTGSSLSVLRIDDENDTTWEQLTGPSFENGTATVSLSRFSIVTVAADTADGMGGSGGSGTGGSGGGGTGGSGGTGGGGGSTVDSELLGAYQITRYQGSQDGCDQVSDMPSPPYLVLYSFRRNDNPDESLLGGTFCADVDDCQQVANDAPEPAIGYSFITGDDQSGWLGWAIASVGSLNDQCTADVQAHTLTSTSAQTINIETKTFETVFPPTIDGNTATCSSADAIAFLNEDLPCMEILVLDAIFEASLQ